MFRYHHIRSSSIYLQINLYQLVIVQQKHIQLFRQLIFIMNFVRNAQKTSGIFMQNSFCPKFVSENPKFKSFSSEIYCPKILCPKYKCPKFWVINVSSHQVIFLIPIPLFINFQNVIYRKPHISIVFLLFSCQNSFIPILPSIIFPTFVQPPFIPPCLFQTQEQAFSEFQIKKIN